MVFVVGCRVPLGTPFGDETMYIVICKHIKTDKKQKDRIVE